MGRAKRIVTTVALFRTARSGVEASAQTSQRTPSSDAPAVIVKEQ